MRLKSPQPLILILAIIFALATSLEYFYLRWHWVESAAQFFFVLILYVGLYHGRKGALITAGVFTLLYLPLFVFISIPALALELPVAVFLALVRALFFFSTAFVAGEIYKQVAGGILEATPEEALDRYVLIDAQTGLYNGRFLLRRLEEELYRANRYRSSFSLALLELPQSLASIDEPDLSVLLKKIGSVLNKESRFSDVVARYASDKIAVVFPFAGRQIADVPISRLGQKVDEILETEGLKVSEGSQAHFVVLSVPEDLARINKFLKELS